MRLNKKIKKLKNENTVSVKSFCEDIKGKSMSNYLVKAPQDSRLDPKTCRLQTFDVAGNMSGKTKGAATQFCLKIENETAVYFHCVSHELNLCFSKVSKIPQVY